MRHDLRSSGLKRQSGLERSDDQHAGSEEPSPVEKSMPAEAALRGDTEPSPVPVFVILCILTFAAGVSSIGDVMHNAFIISAYELVFVIRYGVLLRPWSRGLGIIRIDPIVTLALAAWLVSITVSLLLSPYDLAET